MGSNRIRVMIVDDHQVVRDGIAAILTRHSDMTVVAEASNGLDAVRLFRTHRPDVTLLDLTMPDMDGIQTMRAIGDECPGSRFIILTVHAGADDIHRALERGILHYK